jgi:hypothetical protein
VTTPMPEGTGPGRARRTVSALTRPAVAVWRLLLQGKRLPAVFRGAGQYLLAAAGLTCFCVGAFLVWVPAGWVVAGLAMFVLEFRIQEE